MTFTEFFDRATTGNQPYPYQTRLANSPELPALLKIPTGAGKTEAAILGWLYRLLAHPDADARAATPRRLVYCLPMRTLVEQTVERVRRWLDSLGWAERVGVVTLMGGEPRDQWYLEPEKPTIVIGTQDMLLSRALNRGYGNSPFMWPVEYGLLNNDCLWVMDEVQLMANGLPTSIQLAGLRRKLGAYGHSQSMWMSATVRADWLSTIDHPAPSPAQTLTLEADDLANPRLAKRHNARKIVAEASVSGTQKQRVRRMAESIAGKHRRGSLTLVIVNTVERAQEVYKALNNPRQIRGLEAETALVHSRFRERDRREKNALISRKDLPCAGLIVVATQAVEAGVDISARTLITELAPWASMVQRFGRCNRAGEFERGDVFWVDVGERKQDTAAPYDPDDVAQARELMKSLEGESVGPAALEALSGKMQDPDHLTVIRKRDVVGLFDTTPDLSGSYLDVSQYVRGGDERDVSVFWRNLPAEGDPSEDEPKPRHSETVSVPIGGVRGAPKGVRDYLTGAGRRAWRWDFLDNAWRRVQPYQLHPGMTLMLDAARGGYSPDTGWVPAVRARVAVVEDEDEDRQPEDGQNSDPNSTSQRRWVALSDHSRHVEAEANAILKSALRSIADPEIAKAVSLAALFHDAGKAHPAFQEMLRKGGEDPPKEGMLLAKSQGNGRMDSQRRHFRHELGSALAVLTHASDLDGRTRDLAAYLAASHHGKIRLGIRSLPGRRLRNGALDSNPNPDYLLGYRIESAETLPPVHLGEGLRIPETELDMSVARIGLADDGEPSWLDRTTDLLDWLGPFRLAYLEAIVRAADMRASKKEREGKC